MRSSLLSGLKVDKKGGTNREKEYYIERDKFYSKDLSLYVHKSQNEHDLPFANTG